MSFYQHKSGAEKRRERDDKVKQAKKGERTLFDVGINVASSSICELPEPELSNIAELESVTLSVNEVDNGSDSYQLDSLGKTSDPEEFGVQSTGVPGAIEIQPKQHGFDIGSISDALSTQEIMELVQLGHLPHPELFPKDYTGQIFPIFVLSCKKQNCEKLPREWLVFSPILSSFFCLPCRLFSSNLIHSSTKFPKLASKSGYGVDSKWRKLYDKIPEHERSNTHKECYLKWRELQIRLEKTSSVDNQLIDQIRSDTQKWKKLLQRFIDVILFLGERGLAFRGSSQLIGDAQNGNFLGLLELVSHYDSTLKEHLGKVQKSQREGKRLQAHYLSWSSQNEFIGVCGGLVRASVLDERQSAKYFSVIVDGTPDSAHIEQTTFILRYLTSNENQRYSIKERFLKYVDCNKKTGKQIAEMILKTMNESNISFSDCRGQGYDNASNMSGCYNGTQFHLKEENPLCLFSPCGCHSLNLCGVDSACACNEAVTFFGIVQKIYNCFSSSP